MQKPAVDSEDYPKVANTLAHWRFFGGVAGQPVKVGETVADVTGANPIRRAPLNIDGVAGAQEADLVWSGDHHYLSAAPGSVRFLNTDKNTARMSYFTTDVAAPINPATVPSGYTVEAFLKIDKDWTAQKHAWMNVMTRDGKRGDAGFSDGDPESPPLLFALSSLREVQWEVVPEVSGTRGAKTNWSGEIIADSGCTWPSSTTRSRMKPCCTSRARRCCATPATRLAALAANMPWIIGAGSWDGRRADGFFGSIGEIRIVGKALKPAQWLTARRACPQAGLFHQRQDPVAEEFRSGLKSKKLSCRPSMPACLSRTNCSTICSGVPTTSMLPPMARRLGGSTPSRPRRHGHRSSGSGSRRACGNPAGDDGLVVGARLALGLAADHHGIEQRAHAPADAARGGLHAFGVGGQDRDRAGEVRRARAGDEDHVRMARRVGDARVRAGGADQQWPRIARRRDIGILQFP